MTDTWAFSMRLIADFEIPTSLAAWSAVMPVCSRRRRRAAARRRRRTVRLPVMPVSVAEADELRNDIIPNRELRKGCGPLHDE